VRWHSGGANTVRLLLDRGADTEARDSSWNDTRIDWAAVGGGEQPRTNHAAGGITLEPDDPKPPSPEVAELLMAHLDHQPPRNQTAS
jgi:hypothetical protein